MRELADDNARLREWLAQPAVTPPAVSPPAVSPPAVSLPTVAESSAKVGAKAAARHELQQLPARALDRVYERSL